MKESTLKNKYTLTKVPFYKEPPIEHSLPPKEEA